MSNPLHAAHYADGALHRTVDVVENVRLARDTYRVRFACPEMARRALPGQFFMLRLAGYSDPLIGRALALYDTVCDPEPWGIDLVYLVHGKLTSRLASLAAGQRLDVWGPLGNGFPPQPAEHLVMVAGGIGQTPFPALAREQLGRRQYGDPPRSVASARKVTLCYGARSADYLAGIEDFERLGVEVLVSTDDGTRGHHGLVTDLLERELAQSPLACRIACCGPERMMEAVSHIAQRTETSCQVSLETPMACGIGICFSCVAPVRDQENGWDYKRTCVEGPVFAAEKILW
jgi:dihydroorotate dehydrogenase electron transfer subunit